MLLLLLWMFLCRYFPGNAAHLLCNGPWQQVMVFLARPSRRLIESLLLDVFSLPSLLPFLLPSFLSSVNEMTVSPSPHTHAAFIRTPAASKSSVTCLTLDPILGGHWGGWLHVCVCVCVCVWGVYDGVSVRSGWHDRCETGWVIMSCVQDR